MNGGVRFTLKYLLNYYKALSIWSAWPVPRYSTATTNWTNRKYLFRFF